MQLPARRVVASNMDCGVVEVVARFGDTILDVAHVGPTDTYRIGTAQGVNLSVPGLTCFPLVSAGKVRIPLGVPAAERDGWTELRVGALSIFVSRTQLPRAPIARPRIEWRTPVFVLASLVVHLAVWMLAQMYEPLERLVEQQLPRFRYVHVAPVSEPEVVPKSKPKPAKHAAASSVQPGRTSRVERDQPARPDEPANVAMGMSAAAATARLAAQFDQIDVKGKLEQLRPEDTYYEDEANARGFGGGGNGRQFDPTQREGWGTVESGGFVTMSYDVKLCPNKSCTVRGPIPALYVRTHLHHHMDAIYACYAQHASGPGTIVLTFTITPDGAVRDARGSGLGETGDCAARVVGEIFFKALGNDYDPPRVTHVRYPVKFQASSG